MNDNLPPGVTDADCDPEYETERERKRRIREEELERRGDYEDRGQ